MHAEALLSHDLFTFRFFIKPIQANIINKLYPHNTYTHIRKHTHFESTTDNNRIHLTPLLRFVAAILDFDVTVHCNCKVSNVNVYSVCLMA